MHLIDLHNHSNHSRDAVDPMENLVTHAIDCGISVLGISDHNYWITGRFEEYRSEILALREKYKDKITLLCGMEIALCRLDGLVPSMLEGFDYCLVENVGQTLSFREFLEYQKDFPCAVGLPHTDIFALGEQEGIDCVQQMADHNIFWELNVNYDRAHGYGTHGYYLRFLEDEAQQNHVRRCGLKISVGYDTHILEDYDASRLVRAHKFLAEKNLPLYI